MQLKPNTSEKFFDELHRMRTHAMNEEVPAIMHNAFNVEAPWHRKERR